MELRRLLPVPVGLVQSFRGGSYSDRERFGASVWTLGKDLVVPASVPPRIKRFKHVSLFASFEPAKRFRVSAHSQLCIHALNSGLSELFSI
jgi:hypothetical protein